MKLKDVVNALFCSDDMNLTEKEGYDAVMAIVAKSETKTIRKISKAVAAILAEEE